MDWGRSAPLWFAGYMLVYNADWLYSDPADATNTPLRSQWSARLMASRVVLVWLSGVVLVVWPMVIGRLWMLLPFAMAFGVLCFY